MLILMLDDFQINNLESSTIVLENATSIILFINGDMANFDAAISEHREAVAAIVTTTTTIAIATTTITVTTY